MFSGLTYFFDHSIYFARLCHVNPLCKHEYAFLQMKEAPNQKVQEKKPLLKFKNTKKYMCLERIWRKKCFRACRHRPLIYNLSMFWIIYCMWYTIDIWRLWKINIGLGDFGGEIFQVLIYSKTEQQNGISNVGWWCNICILTKS